MPIARSTLAGISTGVVLLAGAAGFGIGLPKVIEDPATPAGEVPALPDRLDDRMVEASTAFSEAIALTPNAEYQTGLQQLADAAVEADADAVSSLSEVYGDAALRTYYDARALEDSLAGQAGTQQPAEVSVAVIPGGGIASLTQGSRPLQSQGVSYEQRLVEGHPCSVTWVSVDQATGQPLQGEIPAANYAVQCRAERDGLAYVVDGKALLPEEVAGYLDLVLDKTA